MPDPIYTGPRPFAPMPSQAPDAFGMTSGGRNFGGVPLGRAATGASTINPATGRSAIDDGSVGSIPQMPMARVPTLMSHTTSAPGYPMSNPIAVRYPSAETGAGGSNPIGVRYPSSETGAYGANPGTVQLAGGNNYSGNTTMYGGMSQGRARVAPGGYPMSRPQQNTADSTQQSPPVPYAQQLTRGRNAAADQQAQYRMANNTQNAADHVHADPLAGQQAPNPMRMTEDDARQIYYHLQQAFPGQNVDQMFIHQMSNDWHQDGAALLHSWTTGGTLGQPLAEYQEGKPADKGIPVSMLGPANSAGNSNDARIPGMSATHAGMYVGGHDAIPGQWGPGAKPVPGVIAPMLPGYSSTNPPAAPASFPMAQPQQFNGWGAMAPGMAQSAANAANTPPGWTQQQAADVTRERNITADNLDADAEARRQTLPVTQQQQFNAGVNVAQAAVNAPVAAANANAQGRVDAANATSRGRVGAAQATGDSRVQAAQTNGLSNQEVARIRNEGRPASLGKQPESPQEKSLNDRYVASTARLKDATDSYRTLLSAYSTNPTDAQKQELAQAKQQRDVARNDTFASQGMREDYYDSVSGPAANQAKPGATPQPSQIRVRDKSGNMGAIPADQLQDAIQQGYTQIP